MVEKRPALGRGLSALIPDAPLSPQTSARPLEVDTDLLTPNRFQPRTTMDDGRIEELARSIRSNGIIQPIVVRKVDSGYEIIAGERRWRASQRAGLLKVPIVVREMPDDRLLAAALIENLQREDLNPMEEAHAYRRLADEFHLTQEQIADAVGKDRSSVANMTRLLRLPLEVRENVAAGTIAMGHARALLSLPDEASQLRWGREVVSKQLSVRETEVLVKKALTPETSREAPQKDVHTRAAEDRLRFALGTPVRIVRKQKGGRIEVDFSSEQELQRLYEQMVDKKIGPNAERRTKRDEKTN
jgi:ParB family chromosome partitioning protein